MDVLLQFTGTEWLSCEGFLALLAVLWLLVCTVQVFAIDDCKLDRSNSQQGYSWTKSFVFLEARNGKMSQAHSFSSQPQQPDTRHGAKFVTTRCVTPVNRKSYHASFVIRLETLLLKSRRVSIIITIIIIIIILIILIIIIIIIIALQFRWGRGMDYIELKVRE